MEEQINLMNYKIIVDYAKHEMDLLEGSKHSDPTKYQLSRDRYHHARNNFIIKMNDFSLKNIRPQIEFSLKD